MRIAERAAQVWPLLAFAAGNRQLLTYELVGKLTGMHTAGIGSVLEPIQSYCMLNGLPPLTGIVVNKTTGKPGTGFVASDNPVRDFVVIFEHDWLATGCPTPVQLEEAAKVLPSNGVKQV